MMIQTLPKVTTFDEFVEFLPENSGVRYELHNGNIIEMAQPVGDHEEVKSFLGVEIPFEIKRLGLPYGIPNQVIVRPESKDSGYFPDILVMNRDMTMQHWVGVILLVILNNRRSQFVIWWMENIKLVNFKIAIA